MIASRGTGVSRWPSGGFFLFLSLFALFLSFPSRRASNFVSYYVLRSSLSLSLPPSGSLPYCSSHVLAILLLFFSLVDSRRRDSLASRHLSIVRTYPDEEAAHTSLPGTLVSSPGRVSGARLRARCRTQTRTHLSSSVLHPNVCQRPRNFVCVHIIYVTLCAQTRVLILLILLFPRHPRIFSFFSSYREIVINVFFLIFFDTLFFRFVFSTAPETSRLRLRKRSRLVSRPRRALPRRIGGTCVTRAKNIRYYVAES